MSAQLITTLPSLSVTGPVGRGVVLRLEQPALQTVDVVRIHQISLAQLACRARELAQYQRAVVPLAAGDELLGHKVHSVTQGSDDHNVGGAIERCHLLSGEGGVEVGDRNPAEPADVTVDPPDEPIDVIPELAILLNPLSGRGRHLDERGSFGVDRAGGEELAERQEAGRQAFDVVQPIHAQVERLRIAEVVADLGRTLLGLGPDGEGVQ
jgi:hypothetical protein